MPRGKCQPRAGVCGRSGGRPGRGQARTLVYLRSREPSVVACGWLAVGGVAPCGGSGWGRKTCPWRWQ
eukprot:7534860-Prorocentrum_lima.AAC.1